MSFPPTHGRLSGLQTSDQLEANRAPSDSQPVAENMGSVVSILIIAVCSRKVLSNQLSKVNMQIFVGSTAYEVDAATSVESLKLMIENSEFVPSHQICLMNGATILEEGSLEENDVESEDTLQMRLAVQAGMRKKWRKKRMRRLRRKRRKMRQRAR